MITSKVRDHSDRSHIINRIATGKQKYILLSAIGPEKIISTVKSKAQVPVSRSTMNFSSGSSANGLQMNSKQAQSKQITSLPVTCHVQHDLEGWGYTDSKSLMSSWPVLCSSPDCQEERCKDTLKHSYHWDLDWESAALPLDTVSP
jgi:hypothetical protein